MCLCASGRGKEEEEAEVEEEVEEVKEEVEAAAKQTRRDSKCKRGNNNKLTGCQLRDTNLLVVVGSKQACKKTHTHIE